MLGALPAFLSVLSDLSLKDLGIDAFRSDTRANCTGAIVSQYFDRDTFARCFEPQSMAAGSDFEKFVHYSFDGKDAKDTTADKVYDAMTARAAWYHDQKKSGHFAKDHAKGYGPALIDVMEHLLASGSRDGRVALAKVVEVERELVELAAHVINFKQGQGVPASGGSQLSAIRGTWLVRSSGTLGVARVGDGGAVKYVFEREQTEFFTGNALNGLQRIKRVQVVATSDYHDTECVISVHGSMLRLPLGSVVWETKPEGSGVLRWVRSRKTIPGHVRWVRSSMTIRPPAAGKETTDALEVLWAKIGGSANDLHQTYVSFAQQAEYSVLAAFDGDGAVSGAVVFANYIVSAEFEGARRQLNVCYIALLAATVSSAGIGSKLFNAVKEQCAGSLMWLQCMPGSASTTTFWLRKGFHEPGKAWFAQASPQMCKRPIKNLTELGRYLRVAQWSRDTCPLLVCG